MSRRIAAALLGTALLGCTASQSFAQGPVARGGRVEDVVQAVLGVMGYAVVPDSTASGLSLDSGGGDADDIRLNLLQFGYGFTVSPTFPLYIEGFASLARFDPTFLVTQGAEQREIPTRWNSATATIGIGWDFPIVQDLVLRPILNLSLGTVASDGRVATRLLAQEIGQELEFLREGRMVTVGTGGALMLDYERRRPEAEVDVELRFSQLHLDAVYSSSDRVAGSSDAITLGLWSRLRVPTGREVAGKTLRSVWEFSHSEFVGDQAAIGVDRLTQVGAGLELDFGAAGDKFLDRARVVVRYVTGPGVQGSSVGIGIAF